jgi:hypothetical protein
MPQKTNLNIGPYYDDFDKDKNYYKVLFKPGFPIQSRELTTLQSSLQNQIESFGNHFFKEGSVVIPGSVTYDPNYYSVKINEQHLGLDVSIYIKELIGKRIRGQESLVTAVVDNYSLPSQNEGIEEVTLYIKYLNSGSDNQFPTFIAGETLILEETLVYGNTIIENQSSIASVLSTDPTAVGTAVGITSGVYFIRGTFVDVSADKIVLDSYTNNSSYRVGLSIVEDIINSKDDPSLYDNAKGFPNYASPGADRFKISTYLSKKALDDYDDKSFIELVRIQNGELKKIQNKSDYSSIRDYVAKRTYEESGDYTVSDFTIELSNSLNDRVGSNGLYFDNQLTNSGNVPSEELMCVKVSPGKAYIRGYDVELVGTTVIDVEKPRDTETISSTLVPLKFGHLLRINNVHGTPLIGTNENNNYVLLYNSRRNSSNTSLSSDYEIGKARVYSCSLSDAPYSSNVSQWDLYLFDIQTYTVLEISASIPTSDCPESSYIQGASSGASGYLVTTSNTTTLKLIQTSGSFIEGEQIIINGSKSLVRSIKSIIGYGIKDVKSVFQDSSSLGLSVDFIADTVLEKNIPQKFGVFDTITISPKSNGISTARFGGGNFLSLRSGDVIRYQLPGENLETFNRVSGISSDGLFATLEEVPSVTGVCTGGLPSSEINVPIYVGNPRIISSNNSLYFELPNDNVSSVNLSGSSLPIKIQIKGLSTDGEGKLSTTVANSGITNAFFDAYDTERYSVVYSDGSIEDLTEDQVTFANNGANINISGLKLSQTSNVTLNASARKVGAQHKGKQYIRSEKIIINKTILGVGKDPAGLSTSNYYGLRVQDKEISLNIADASKVIGVFESVDELDPTLDKLVFTAGLNLDNLSIIGEQVFGEQSGATAQLTQRTSSTTVEICYLNSNKFIPGESVRFKESNIVGTLQQILAGRHVNITSDFILDKGHRSQYYDYSRIVRKDSSRVPSRKILVVFNYYDVPINDKGDLYTANSYNYERYRDDIPLLEGGIRASDILDFRPRVGKFGLTNRSPFSFSSRNFGIPSGSSSTVIVAPNESSVVGYSYYLPRIDKVVLNKLGQISLIKGVSSPRPTEPTNVEESITLGLIKLPPYLYKPSDAKIVISDNKRYTMREISKLEDRLETVEQLTSLSLLELSTKSLQVQDAEGLDRFKTGFFADSFQNLAFININDPDAKCDIDTEATELNTPIDFYTLKPQLGLNGSLNSDTADYDTDLELLDPNVKKSGDLVTLNYSEVGWIEQPFATRVENVNPFNMITWVGRVNLSPSADSWVRTVFVRSGSTRFELGDTDIHYVENILISSDADEYIRPRNVRFTTNGLKPLTRYYPFFDGSNSIDFIPKLIEIQMISGIFSVGEDVDGYIGDEKVASFRLCQSNHKSGTYNSPSLIYSENPYNRTLKLSSSYSASSTFINVDIASLVDDSFGKYYGYVNSQVTLVGRTSFAQATVQTPRLITDSFGYIEGSIYFRDPLSSPPPPVRFRTGTKTLKLTSSQTNESNPSGSLLISSGEGTYSTSGRVDIYRQTNVVVRVPPPPPPPPPPGRPPIDPLAQTFTVDETGAFLKAVDLYFANKDENEAVTIELRTVELGTPTNQLVQDFASVTLNPGDVNISDDASVPTKISFRSPIYLQPNTEYALVILAPSSDKYEVWIGRFGEITVDTQNLPDAESILMNRQYLGGSLFKSQNGTIWTANQNEDLKFKLYKCSFVNSGTVYFYNPDLGIEDSNVSTLTSNPIKTYPRKIKIGIVTTTDPSIVNQFRVGSKIGQGDGAYGFLERIGGGIDSSSIFNVGIGYSNGIYYDVPLYNISGYGEGARATLQFSNNQLSGITSITNGGSGYCLGDVLGISTFAVSKGKGGSISITQLTGMDILYLDSVQGETFAQGNSLSVFNDLGFPVLTDAQMRGSSSVISPLYDGNVITVEGYGHGMHANNNVVTLRNLSPDTAPTYLTSELRSDDIIISVASTVPFATFEGYPSPTGYLKINNEIIYYNSVGDGILGIGTRGADGTLIRSHPINSTVYKYELGGISLSRINTTHTLPSDASLRSLRDNDTFCIKVSRGLRDSGSTMLNFTDESVCGGDHAISTKNVQFNKLIPQINVITPGQSTKIETRVRTVSATSCSGSETSFLDQGFESIELNQKNDFPTTRMVCSRVNELARLANLPRNKSFTLSISMESNDPNLSPVVDTANAALIFSRNRLNSPIGDYVYDSRSNLLFGDPHSAVYVSNRINTAQPATSLRVYLSAYRDSSADFRVLYRLFSVGSDNVSQVYELFPGYDNLKDLDGDGFGDTLIDKTLNTGNPDALVKASRDDEFVEYQYTADNLDQFTGFVIKIVMSGTNEAKPPRFKDLRVIALA